MSRLFLLVALAHLSLFIIGCDSDDKTNLSSETLIPLVDIEGNTYQVRRIGTQVWMVENLKVQTYNDGDPIPKITSTQEWFNGGQPGFSLYNNLETETSTLFGALYNWYVIDTKKLCPEGWRIPTLEDFNTLINFAGGEANAGNALKSIEFWEEPNTEATDTFGFFALPVGFRNLDGIFKDRLYETAFWTSTKEYEGNDYSDGSAWTITMRSNSSSARNFSRSVKNGYSCRCIKNE